ncbi:unnamed protein product [Darwinula stevensoni]|uniref:C-type lectin domain-containing protein n=1 Tax=Darwinula stevensoni TaxID=69355 RepID=A0A7R9FQ28_9CRUS|nr:unnamed protein product [Darwinula stevensoni]CAG0898966.1 unnamed protein product [Darwinula stevensoni]
MALASSLDLNCGNIGFREGYTLAPGTRSYVKMTVSSINANDAATACQKEGAQLLSSNNAAVHNHTMQLWKIRPSGTNSFWVGGRSVGNKNSWVFPDELSLMKDKFAGIKGDAN